MNFEYTPEFKKDVKRLQKKWRSLPGDLSDAELQIADLYGASEDLSEQVEYRAAFFNGKRATILHKTDNGREVVKMRLDVSALGTNSKVRIVFIAMIADGRVQFIELYSKSDKSRVNQSRIKQYLE
jgi:hypothetical protein